MIHHANESAITPELEAEFQAAVRQGMDRYKWGHIKLIPELSQERQPQ